MFMRQGNSFCHASSSLLPPRLLQVSLASSCSTALLDSSLLHS